MKKTLRMPYQVNHIFTFLFSFTIFLSSTTHAQTYTDNASSYGGVWGDNSNNSNSCSNIGFGNWSITNRSNTGTFIGNPANNGMGTTGIGTTAFGMFATGAEYSDAYRSIIGGMQVGDALSFFWAINWTANGGGKGFDFRVGNTNVFNVNNWNSDAITTTNGTAFTAFGTAPMLVTLTRESSTTYSFSMTARNGGATYTTTINNSSSINGINFYIGNQNDGNGNRNMYLNAFQLTKPRYRSSASGNWTDPAVWQISTNGGTSWSAASSAPTGTFDAITVQNGHSITLNTSGSVGSLVIDAGGTFNNGTAQTLTMAACNATITNNGTFNRNTGTISFSSSGTVNGAVEFFNLSIAGNLTLGSGASRSTVHNNLTINSGGAIAAQSPLYATGSTLIYNSGGNYNRANEWSGSTDAVEQPFHVTVNAGTTLDLDVKKNIETNNAHYDGEGRIMRGDLDLFGTLTMGGDGGTMAEDLTVGGNVTIRSTGTLRLGSQKPSDIKIADISLGGNWVHETGGTFDPSRRAVIFNGATTAEQTVSFSGTESFAYFVINKSNNGTVRMLCNSRVFGTNQGNLFQILNGNLDLNGRSMTLEIFDVVNSVDQNILIDGSGTGESLVRNIINTNNATPSLFTITHNQATQRLTGVLRNNVANESKLSFGSNVVVVIEGTVNGNMGVNFGNTITTINGTLRINRRGFVNLFPPTYAASSLLQYNTGGDYNRNVEWNASAGPGYPFNVQLSTSGTRLIAGGAALSGSAANTGTALNLAGNLTIDASTSFDMTNGGLHNMTVPLIVGQDINLNGVLIASGNANGNVQLGKNWTRHITTGTFTHNTRRLIFNSSQPSIIDLSAAGMETFYDVETAKSSAATTVTLNKPVTISNAFYFGTGRVISSLSNLLTFNDNTMADGESDNSFVDGPVAKIGNDAFSFPVGKEIRPTAISIYNLAGLTGGYRPIEISAPGSATDVFTAEFFHRNANLIGPVTSPGLQGVSACEYWGLRRQSSTDVSVTLSWMPKSVCNPTSYVTNVSAIVVAMSSNGTPLTHPSGQWNFHGGSASGNATSGTATWTAPLGANYKLSTLSGYEAYTPFTLGTTNWRDAPLPFEIKNFQAVGKNNNVQLNWLVNNNDQVRYYTIERSRNGLQFESFKQVNARFNESTSKYSDLDPTPFNGWGYYRLRITDLSGNISYSSIQKVWMGQTITQIQLSPNPAKDRLWISLAEPEKITEISIVNSLGQLLLKQNRLLTTNQLNITALQPGIYYVRIVGQNGITTEPFVKE